MGTKDRGMKIHYIVFLLILLLLVYLFFSRPKSEGFKAPETVVCFLCVCPSQKVIGFAQQLSKKYKTYIVCDDYNCNTPNIPGITFVKITDSESASAGWTKCNITIAKPTTAWDKALYYFAVKDTTAAHVWFIEEDVFVPNASVLIKIDANCPDADLVAKQNVRDDEDPEFIWWHDAEGYLKKPLYRSLVCAARLSRRLLDAVKAFVKQHGRLVFIEIIFNTIVVQQGMKLEMPKELSKIVWRHHWTPETVDAHHLFHPIKDVNLHDSYRDRLKQVAAREN
jgi:hypothetical protein